MVMNNLFGCISKAVPGKSVCIPTDSPVLRRSGSVEFYFKQQTKLAAGSERFVCHVRRSGVKTMSSPISRVCDNSDGTKVVRMDFMLAGLLVGTS